MTAIPGLIIDGSPLFKKIMASIVLASIFFLSLLSVIVYYSNEILEENLLARQSEFELSNIKSLLSQNPQLDLPKSSSLSIFLASRDTTHPVPDYLSSLAAGIHHDFEINQKSFHILISELGDDIIYIQTDITEIERTEDLLGIILFIAWVVMIIIIIFIARILSRKLSNPIAQLNLELASINPDQRGVQLSKHYENDEVGSIARAFDSYIRKMDDYVERQMAFAAMASHELRSPLTIIQTSADLIASQSDDDKFNPQLDKIQRASVNMANMIHALLAITRDTPVEPDKESISLYFLIADIIDSSKPEIIAKKIVIDNKLPIESSLLADKTLLTVVLSNLIKNSIRHGGDSQISIYLDKQCLCIADTGLSIDTDALNHIFEFGYRGNNSQGYGIGLYISRLICDRQHWKLSLSSNDAGGTTASVYFPALTIN